MPGFDICTDSSYDVPEELIAKYNVRMVSYYVTFDGDKYYREKVDITNKELYHTLRTTNVFPKTSMPSIKDFTDAFKPSLEEGRDVLCICLTSKFSGSFHNAVKTADIMHAEFPDRKIVVLDSTLATMLQGQFVLDAAKLRDAGASIDDAARLLDGNKLNCGAYITVDSLEYLQRGGRIGKVSAFAGSILGIKPIISLHDGELFPISKIRGRKKAMSEIIELTQKHIGNAVNEYTISAIHSDCPDEGAELLAQIKGLTGFDVFPHLCEMGTTIGAHIGPTVLGVGYMKKINY